MALSPKTYTLPVRTASATAHSIDENIVTPPPVDGAWPAAGKRRTAGVVVSNAFKQYDEPLLREAAGKYDLMSMQGLFQYDTSGRQSTLDRLIPFKAEYPNTHVISYVNTCEFPKERPSYGHDVFKWEHIIDGAGRNFLSTSGGREITSGWAVPTSNEFFRINLNGSPGDGTYTYLADWIGTETVAHFRDLRGGGDGSRSLLEPVQGSTLPATDGFWQDVQDEIPYKNYRYGLYGTVATVNGENDITCSWSYVDGTANTKIAELLAAGTRITVTISNVAEDRYTCARMLSYDSGASRMTISGADWTPVVGATVGVNCLILSYSQDYYNDGTSESDSKNGDGRLEWQQGNKRFHERLRLELVAAGIDPATKHIYAGNAGSWGLNKEADRLRTDEPLYLGHYSTGLWEHINQHLGLERVFRQDHYETGFTDLAAFARMHNYTTALCRDEGDPNIPGGAAGCIWHWIGYNFFDLNNKIKRPIDHAFDRSGYALSLMFDQAWFGCIGSYQYAHWIDEMTLDVGTWERTRNLITGYDWSTHLSHGLRATDLPNGVFAERSDTILALWRNGTPTVGATWLPSHLGGSSVSVDLSSLIPPGKKLIHMDAANYTHPTTGMRCHSTFTDPVVNDGSDVGSSIDMAVYEGWVLQIVDI